MTYPQQEECRMKMNETRTPGRKLLSIFGFAVALFAVASTARVNAQICNHGIGGSMAVFGTNCLGVTVSQFAHPGDFVGIRICADYNDECGNTLCKHDTYVITNVVV